MDDGYLHVYGQTEWHLDLLIVGNRRGLEMLRSVIDSALNRKTGRAKTTNHPSVFAGDGEGYFIKVVTTDEDQMYHLRMPYISPFFQSNYDKHEIDPVNLEPVKWYPTTWPEFGLTFADPNSWLSRLRRKWRIWRYMHKRKKGKRDA